MNEQLHACLELVGSCVGVSAGLLLLVRSLYGKPKPHLIWVVAGLTAIATLDGFHSVSPWDQVPGQGWLRHISTLIGGLLFAAVWTRPPVEERLTGKFFTLVAATAASASFVVLMWPGGLPNATNPQNYTVWSAGFNCIGGLGFLSAAAFFTTRFVKFNESEDLAFMGFTLLFAVSSFFFGTSSPWAFDWWAWHVFRVAAFGVLFTVFYQIVVASYVEIQRTGREIAQLNLELEQRVQDRTAQLAVALTELESFSYSVSHDLRTPLSGIRGYARLLIDEYKAQIPTEANLFLAKIDACAKRMDQLIDGILSLSMLGECKIVKERASMRTLVDEAIETVVASEGGQICAEVKIHPLPEVWADPLLLRNVMVILLTNAFKYSRSAQPAVVEVGSWVTEVSGERVFYVKDNGAGFDANGAEGLFVAFQRFHSADKFEGSGIGLATAHRIVSRHGGRIWAESQVGQGATFFFTLGHDEPSADASRLS